MGTLRQQHLKALGFTSDSDPSENEIKSAFKKLSLTCHPDKNSNPEAKEKFIVITKARDFLLLSNEQQQSEEDKLQAEKEPRKNTYNQRTRPSYDVGDYYFQRIAELIARMDRERTQRKVREAKEAKEEARRAEEARKAKEQARKIKIAHQQKLQAQKSVSERFNSQLEKIFSPTSRAIFSGLATALFAHTCGVSWLPSIMMSLPVSFATFEISKAFKNGLVKFAEFYADPEHIKDIQSSITKKALKAGVEAKSWSGVFWSWGNYATYICPDEYKIGQIYAMNDETDVVAEIQKCRFSLPM